MITIYDIAKECGLSPSTVSKALNDRFDVSFKVKNKVIKTAREMGYVSNQVAKNLITKRTHNIGVLMWSELCDGYELGFTHVFFAEILNVFRRTMEENGYDISFLSNKNAAFGCSYWNYYQSKRLDGLFVICGSIVPEDLKNFIDSHCPIVAFEHSNERITTINIDNEKIYYETGKYLVSAGYKTLIYCIGGKNLSAQERKKGLERVASEHPEISLLFRSIKYYSYYESLETTKEILSCGYEKPCILYPDDYSAMGGVRAAWECGMNCPQQVGIVGCDGTRILQKFFPRLSTIRQDSEEIGKVAAESLISQIDSKRTPRKIILTAQFMKGETCL